MLTQQLPSCESSSRLGRLLPLLLLISVLFPATAFAQASYTGTTATANFGPQTIGVASAARSFNFSIAAGTKVGSIAVVTTGVAKLDFTNATGTTCLAQTYASAATCVVNVTLTPKVAGLRKGAVVFYSKANNAGNILGSVTIYGVGAGPQIAYGPGTVSAIDRTMRNVIGLSDPLSMTVDAAGNLFILDEQSNPARYRIVEVPASGATPISSDPSVNGEALYLPSCVTVDGAGNLYIGDFNGRVVVVPAGGGAATALQPVVNNIALNYPSGLAVDGAGDLFISDYINNRVLELPAGGGAAMAIDPAVNGVTLNDPHGLAVDGAGNLFIADLGNDRVVKVPAGNGAATAITPAANGEQLRNPKEVAVDGAGDLFIADNINHRVVEVPAAAAAAMAIDPTYYVSGMGDVFGVTVDGAGNLYMVQSGLQSGTNIVEEVQYAHSSTLNFVTPTDLGSVDAVDGAQTIQVVNVGNQVLPLTGLGYPADFSPASGDPNACTNSTTLSPGQSCDLSIEFSPLHTGSLSESVTLNAAALSGSGAVQSIVVTGTAEEQAALTSPAPGAMLTGSSVLFTWSTGAGATGYYLSVGTLGVGSTNIFNTGKRNVTSWTATGLPTNGQTLYVRLTTYFNNIQMHADYTYTAQSSSVLTSPAIGSTLSGSSVTFTWTAAPGAISYNLWLGSTGAGSYNLYASPTTTTTSVKVAGLPTNGETIYARLYTKYNGETTYVDSTYTAK